MPSHRLLGALLGSMAFALVGMVSHVRAERMVALASIFPLTSMVEQLGGERWQVFTLIPAGASAHTYEPTPEQVRLMAQARVFFQIGLGLEFWLEKLVHAAQNPTMRRIDLAEAIEPLPSPSAELAPKAQQHRQRDHAQHDEHVSQEAGQHEHKHPGLDPHYWLDPLRMQQVVKRIEQVLVEIDPDHATSYNQRAERLRRNLAALHQEIQGQTQGLQERRFIAMHSAWTYFAARYNLQQMAVIEPFPGREPSPRYLAELAKLMRREGVKAVIIEPQLSTSAAQALARETGARVGMLDPTGGPGVPGRDDYFALMRYNVAELVKLLR
ncbi:MAG TPA: metal ABC transporter substrate-binding protein [Alphaproteobacteria bacterium]|nr:metal ABC transporter substrate-binding protein [Alphaproteobacteria bacterium]